MIGGAKGIGIGIDFGIPNQYCRATSKPYIEKDVLDSLRVVASAYGKSNNDADRSIVKNLVDASNPFIISNTAFKLNSGFGEYEQDFTDWKKSTKVTSFDSESIKFTSDITWVLLYHPSSIGKDIPSFKVRIKLYGEGTLYYNYITQEGTYTNVAVKSEIFETPICYNTKYTGEKGVNVGFTLNVISGECSGTIEQIPSFEGAFVTDGVNDLITSTKTVQEMLGGSNELTIVSMVHQVKDSANNVSFTNYIRGSANGYFRNIVNNYDKTGIYGYTSSDLKGLSVVNNILGDKNDYTSNGDNRDSIINGNFSVQGYSYNDGNNTGDFSSVAWYWTIIANKVLTTDQINQVIAYYNLDKWVTPDILYDVKKQGITNENHAEFNDKLIDYSGNGRDIQLNNIAWKGDSGIGKYETDFTKWLLDQVVDITRKYSSFNIKTKNDSRVNSWVVRAQDTVIPSMKVKVTGISSSVESLIYRYSVIDDKDYYIDITSDGIYELPQTNGKGWEGFRIVGKNFNISVEQIPSHAGALCLDGVNDFGKVTGMPVYKDYTFIADRYINNNVGSVASKSVDSNQYGAFIFEIGRGNYSFNVNSTVATNLNKDRTISYLSKYSYNGENVNVGNEEDSNSLWIGTIRDNDTRFSNMAIYSLMSFPYSMSEFLIERQLKKHKLGTLYPDMVEFRPIVKSNSEYQVVDCYIDTLPAVVGNYYPINSKLRIAVTTKGAADEVTSLTVNGVSLGTPSVNGNRFTFNGTLSDKSPQKINITIDEYIRYEDIVQPYPSFVKLENLDRTYTYTWGDKLKVGDTIRYNSSVNLLEGAYTLKGQLECNGVYVYDNNQYITVAKEMIFAWTNSPIWSIDNNEPKCILSPRLLSIPNSSYKILGYIPDISGHGNHGVIHNSAYEGASGVNEDGSYQFDGVDDFVTIPTVTGGKQVLMKVNWDSLNHVLYDQRNNAEAPFCIVAASGTIAYNQRNVGGNTYIDGILNNHILVDDLQAITHNIVLNNDYNVANSNSFIGTNYTKSIYAKMSLYDFMLFDNISTDDKIKELNEYVGIEGDVWGILTKLSNSTLISNETLIKNE